MGGIVLDQLEPGSLGIPGPVEMQIGLPFPEECVGLVGRPVGHLVQLPGAAKHVATSGERSGQQGSQLAVVRRSAHLLERGGLGGGGFALPQQPFNGGRVRHGASIAPVPPGVPAAASHAESVRTNNFPKIARNRPDGTGNRRDLTGGRSGISAGAMASIIRVMTDESHERKAAARTSPRRIVPCYRRRASAAKLRAFPGESRSTRRCQARASSNRPIFSRSEARCWYSSRCGWRPSVLISSTS